MQATVQTVTVSDELKRYIVSLVRATREAEGVRLGASPRAALTLMKCAQSLALLNGFDFVTPDAIQEIAVPAIVHRISLDHQARFGGQCATSVVEAILAQTPVPA